LIEGLISLELRDRSGGILARHTQEMQSLVRNFIVMLETAFKGVNTKFPPPPPQAAVDTSGASRGMGIMNYQRGATQGWRVDADAGDQLLLRNEPTDWGILVGSDNTPVSITDYSLKAPYPHGRGRGYMNYLSTSIEGPFVGGYVWFRVKRVVVNESDINQTIWEVGLVGREFYTWNKFLFFRDVLTDPIIMPPNSLVEITIEIRATPAPYIALYAKDFAPGYDSSIVHRFT